MEKLSLLCHNDPYNNHSPTSVISDNYPVSLALRITGHTPPPLTDDCHYLFKNVISYRFTV